MGFELSPHVFHWIELRCIGRQTLDFNVPAGTGDVISDQLAPMNGGSIPEDQQLARDVPLQVFEKLHHLRSFDAAGMNLEEKAQEHQPADDGKTLPIEGFLKQWRLAARRPGAHAGRSCAQAAFIDKDNQAALPLRFFLTRATSSVSTDGWPLRRAQSHGVPGAGN